MNGTQPKKNRKKKHNDVKTKNVSWGNLESTVTEEKKTLPSTPYPKAVKKFKVSANSTPISLSFNPCESDENDDISCSLPDLPELPALPEVTNKKRKRKQSNWIITSCTEIKPDKTNKPINEPARLKITKKMTNSDKRIVNTRNGSYIFNEDTFTTKKIANQIFQNMMKNEIDLSEDDSDIPELVPIEEDFIVYESSSSSDESCDLNLDILFDPPVVEFDRKMCQIIEPKIKTPNKRNKIQEMKSGVPKIDLPERKEKIKTPNKTNSIQEIDLAERKEGKIKTLNKTNSIQEIDLPERKEDVPKIKDLQLKDIPERKSAKIDILKKVEYFISDTYCILILKHPFKLYFNGKLSVTVLSGKLEVLGHTLEFNNGKEFEIYNPRGQSFLCLETLNSQKNPNISNILEKYLDKENLTKLWETLNDNDCVIAVQDIKNNMTDYLEKHMAQHLYPNTIQFNKRPLLKLENNLNCLFYTETAPLKLYKKHEYWPKFVSESLLKVLENNSRTILCGGKSVGKSTLLRYMINKMLNEVSEVVCIDLDPGQCEFTIGGCVSVSVIDSPIFGPNYTHLKKPKKSFFIGDVNVTNVLDRYINSVTKLLDYCDANICKKLPVIVNCMGFSKSIGTDLIVLIIKLFKPSIVVQLESTKNHRNYSSHLTQEFVNNFTPSFPLQLPNDKLTFSLKTINSMAEDLVSGEWISEAKILREMCVLSYFSQMLENKKEITAAVPYGVKLSSIKIHNINYSQEHILATINGNLVALCETNETSIETKTALLCHGFGIVRGIDKQSGELYLLTPIHEDLLENVNLLVRGNISLPPSVCMTSGHQGLVPYIQLGTLQGTSAIPKRSFISWKVLLNKK